MEEGDYYLLRSPVVDLTRRPFYCLKYWFQNFGKGFGRFVVAMGSNAVGYLLNKNVDAIEYDFSRNVIDWKYKQINIMLVSELK